MITFCNTCHGLQLSHHWTEYWLGREDELPAEQQNGALV